MEGLQRVLDHLTPAESPGPPNGRLLVSRREETVTLARWAHGREEATFTSEVAGVTWHVIVDKHQGRRE